MTKPIAIGFTDGVPALDELRQRVAAGHHDFAIMLAGGLAISRKTITEGPGGGLRIVNEIDGTSHVLSTPELWSQSNVGEALDKRALLDMDGDDGLVNVAGRGWVAAEPWLAEVRAAMPAPAVNDDPLRFVLDQAPGAIRLGSDDEAEWEPADPKLLLEVCDIGPNTVASMDIEAEGFDDKAAATSIELTIEDIDDLIATLTRIKEDAIANRGFELRASGYWTNGRE
jgi:hypothetical protein